MPCATLVDVRDSPELSDADIILAVREGDSEMFGLLFDRWFDRVHDVARNIVRNSDTAADVAQDVFISAWQQLDKLDQPDAFGGWLLRITRNGALDRLQRENRSRPQEDHVVTRQHDAGAPDPMGTRRREDPADLAEDFERDDLVNAAAVALGVKDASLLDLHMRHGLGAAEIAKETGASSNSVHQQLFRMRDRLGNAIGAMLLWQRGRPSCEKLGALVTTDSEFDADVFGVVERHRRGCDDCTRRRSGLVAPEALFAALPVAVVPLALRTGVEQAVRAAGVPLGPGAPASFSETGSQGTTSESDTASVEPAVADQVRSGAESHRFTTRRILMAAVIVLLVSAGVTGLVIARRSSGEVSGSLANQQSLDGGNTAPIVSSNVADTSGTSDSTTQSTTDQSTTIQPISDQPTTTITAAAVPAPTTESPAAQPQGPTTVPLAPNPPSATTAPPQIVVVATTAPVATAQPTTVPPTPTTVPAATTTAAPVAPEVVRFTAKVGPGGLLCISPSQSPRTFEWTATNATSATLTIAGVSRVVAVAGSLNACGGSGELAVLEAQGPGGTAQRSLTLP